MLTVTVERDCHNKWLWQAWGGTFWKLRESFGFPLEKCQIYSIILLGSLGFMNMRGSINGLTKNRVAQNFEQFFPTCSLEISEKQPRRLNFFLPSHLRILIFLQNCLEINLPF